MSEKEEVLLRLRQSREINTAEKTKNWKVAFDLYNEATGNKLKPDCPKCFKKVLEWLQEP